MPELWDPWNIPESGFPRKGEPSDKLRFLLNYAILAPSSHNSQPWLFKVVGETLELYADRTRALPVVDPEDRELVMSCGAALFNLRIAFRHYGYEAAVEILSDPRNPDLLARIAFGTEKAPTPDEQLLFESIPKRRTNRMPFEDRKVPEELLTDLQQAAKIEGAWLYVIKKEDERNKIADVIADADRTQMADGHFRRELAAWIHPNRTASHDGMPGFAHRLGSVTSALAPLVVRTFDIGKGQAARDRELAAGSPVLVLLGTERDTVQAWLSVGQALERVLLRARAENVWASFLDQPIELPELRSKLLDTLGLVGFPQFLLRLGYGQEVKPTPRRTPGEVLVRGR